MPFWGSIHPCFYEVVSGFLGMDVSIMYCVNSCKSYCFWDQFSETDCLVDETALFIHLWVDLIIYLFCATAQQGVSGSIIDSGNSLKTEI